MAAGSKRRSSCCPLRLRDWRWNAFSRLDCASLRKKSASCDHETPRRHRRRHAAKVAQSGRRMPRRPTLKAVEAVLKDLVCSGGNDASTLRGTARQYDNTHGHYLRDAGLLAPVLHRRRSRIKDSKDCPVSASLTDTDRAKLLHVKRKGIEQCRKAGVLRRSRISNGTGTYKLGLRSSKQPRQQPGGRARRNPGRSAALHRWIASPRA